MPDRPLAGVTVVEFAGLGPTPFAGMMLADLGATVLRVVRDGPALPPEYTPGEAMEANRPQRVIDLKTTAGRAQALEVVAASEVLLEGFRPGVMERLGLGPETCHARNPALVYARITGWGQHGAQAQMAGHDINYLARAGALWPIGPADRPPPPPLNYVADFGGGGMLAVVGVLAALAAARAGATSQVVDAAMLDGAAALTTQLHGWIGAGFWQERRGSNVLDGGCYFYRCYETADGEYMAVGAIEPKFHDALIEGLGLDLASFQNPMQRHTWPDRATRLAAVFATRTRSAWEDVFADRDACVTAVLRPSEAASHPDNVARGLFLRGPGGMALPAPVPRFQKR